MATRHTISHADELYAGNAFHAGANAEGRRGTRLSNLHHKIYGAVTTADTDGVVDGATASGAATIGGALASGGIATFDVARAASITSTADESGTTVTITGKDEYGRALVEDVVGPNNTTVNGLKAFLSVSGVSLDATGVSTNGVDVGDSTKLGLPYRAATLGNVAGVYIDGVAATGVTTAVVAGFAATGVTTATTVDVRGTFTPAPVPNGTRIFGVLMNLDDLVSSGAKAYGTDQFGG